MFLGIDHLVIAVADPDDAAAQLEAQLGLEATGGGRHDTLGTSEPPFLIEHDPASAEWAAADRAARRTQEHAIGGPVRLEVLELTVNDVNGTIQRFLRTTGLRFRPSLAGGGARDSNVGGQLVRLRPRRGASGAAVVRLTAPVADGRAVELFGCRWVVRPSG